MARTSAYNNMKQKTKQVIRKPTHIIWSISTCISPWHICANKDRIDELQAEIDRIKRCADGTRGQVDRIKPEVAKDTRAPTGPAPALGLHIGRPLGRIFCLFYLLLFYFYFLSRPFLVYEVVSLGWFGGVSLASLHKACKITWKSRKWRNNKRSFLDPKHQKFDEKSECVMT